MTNREMIEWLSIVEGLISKHSTPARKRGKYKGHGLTDTLAWIEDLAILVQSSIRKHNRGKAYDENMAIASKLGMILAVWYANVHRAKSYDANRPLSRRKANRVASKYRGELARLLCDDEVMGKVWKGQVFNVPFGKGMKAGKFI